MFNYILDELFEIDYEEFKVVVDVLEDDGVCYVGYYFNGYVSFNCKVIGFLSGILVFNMWN